MAKFGPKPLFSWDQFSSDVTWLNTNWIQPEEELGKEQLRTGKLHTTERGKCLSIYMVLCLINGSIVHGGFAFRTFLALSERIIFYNNLTKHCQKDTDYFIHFAIYFLNSLDPDNFLRRPSWSSLCMKEKIDMGEIYSFLGSPGKNQHFGEDREGPYPKD